jgi:hypothetical protein
MSPKRAPLFLARRAYRLRRLRDAARLLPFLGLFLFMLPLLWAPKPIQPGHLAEVRNTAWDGLWLAGCWAVLVVVAAILAPLLGREEDDLADRPDEGPSPLPPGGPAP